MKFVFRKLDEEEILLNEKKEKYGILENEDGLYELCNKDNENSFLTVDVVYEDGIYYVSFDEPSEWADSNIVIGYLIDDKEDYLNNKFYTKNLTNGKEIKKDAIKNLIERGYSLEELAKIENYNEIGIVEYVAKGNYSIENNQIIKE